MRLLIVLLLVSSNSAYALVTRSAALDPDENKISFESQSERGKVEPNENRTSFQDAKIDIYRLKYSRGLADFSVFLNPNIHIEYGHFSSAEERVGAITFYRPDTGYYTNLGFSADFIHDPDKQLGFYISVRPSAKYNVNKFSNPRIDSFSFGLVSANNLSRSVFQKNLIHYGSGDGNDQNPSLAVDTGFGFRLNEYVGRPLILTSSLFLETDLRNRFDPAYDAAFSAPGETDRVRSFKYGVLVGVSFDIHKNLSVSFDHLQKLGGYDARSTQISKTGLAYKF